MKNNNENEKNGSHRRRRDLNSDKNEKENWMPFDASTSRYERVGFF